MAGTDAVRQYLAERLADAGVALSADRLVAEAGAGGGRKPGELARTLDIANPQPVALAMMIARAEEGRIADALALTAVAIERRPAPPVRAFLDGLERVAERPDGPLVDADGRPLVFVVSYPRSGNTRFLNIMAAAFPGSRFTALRGEGRYVSPRGPGCIAHGPVFVKDHALREEYRRNPVLYLARDGRDCCLSFNDFKLRKADTDPAAVREGADSLALILKAGAADFGGWPAHLTAALDWHATGLPLTVLHYDALMAPESYEPVAAALAAAGVDLSRDDYARGLRNAEEKEAQLRARNPGWARGRIYPQGSMMDRWLDVEAPSKWRAVLGPEDKARVHAAGFTEPLLRAGFEEDPNWWQSA